MSVIPCDTPMFCKCIFINREQSVNNDLQDDYDKACLTKSKLCCKWTGVVRYGLFIHKYINSVAAHLIAIISFRHIRPVINIILNNTKGNNNPDSITFTKPYNEGTLIQSSVISRHTLILKHTVSFSSAHRF